MWQKVRDLGSLSLNLSLLSKRLKKENKASDRSQRGLPKGVYFVLKANVGGCWQQQG
jgi:hypothetical protein